ncbi:MAG: hypothetical protein JNK90_29975 [Planctomycetaceae bacterium]|nr:hypothetical protein [Planctomycetaceae bacterium]
MASMFPVRPFYCLWILIVFCSLPALAQEGKAKGSQTPGEDSRPLILAHYMPWYTAKPFRDQWGWHWTMNHFDPEKETESKRQIASKFHPLIGQSSGHQGGRGPWSSLEDLSSPPPELSGGIYGCCSDGGSKGEMNGYGNRGSLGLNLSIIASYSFARDWDDETRRAY